MSEQTRGGSHRIRGGGVVMSGQEDRRWDWEALQEI